MKKWIICWTALTIATAALAQNTDVPLQVMLPQEAGIPAEAARYLHDKLLDLVAGRATAVDDDGASPFYITAKVLTESKDVVGSAPAMIAEDLVVTLYITDRVCGRLYGRLPLRAKGVAESESKAFIAAIRRMNLNNDKVKAFLEEGRQQIVHYYTEQGPVILQNARMLASQREYEKALFQLASVPVACPVLYAQAQTAMSEIYRQYVDYEGERLLARARTIWAATQNRDGAAEAGELLSEIDPEAACRRSAEGLVQEIRKRIGEEWTLAMKAYGDGVDLERRRIDAARQVGVAYGNHQQPSTTNIR